MRDSNEVKIQRRRRGNVNAMILLESPSKDVLGLQFGKLHFVVELESGA